MPAFDTFIDRIQQIHQQLGISAEYMLKTQLPLCVEPDDLVATELDFYQRPQRLSKPAFVAWCEMKNSADKDGVTLFLLSAYRSIEYQQQLIEKKVADGRSIQAVLQVNAAPGYSEHHTGRAVDIGTFGCAALVEEFEDTEAFHWLNENSERFGFCLSYPRDNPFGISYEPWHWCYKTVTE